MRLLGPASLSIVLLAGCASGSEESIYGPPPPPRDLAYRCADGHMARITYANGGWFVKARASLVWDGRTIALQASPPTYGLRYVSADDAADPVMIWLARGEEAWITEIARNAPRTRRNARSLIARASARAARAVPPKPGARLTDPVCVAHLPHPWPRSAPAH